MIDRIAPTIRPAGKNDGTQRWESLLFAHWKVPHEVLRGAVPAELDIDTFEGDAFLGVVPFKMRDVRPRWLPRRLAFNFLETNVRTYVVHHGRPGVYFFSLDADSRLAVMAARLGWSLPYFHAQMSCQSTGGGFSYHSRRSGGGGDHDVTFRIKEELGPSKPGTLEHFLLERYLLFVRSRGIIKVGQVHHEPYQAWTAEIEQYHEKLVSAAGIHTVKRRPDLVHYSPGVDVEVFGIRPSEAR